MNTSSTEKPDSDASIEEPYQSLVVIIVDTNPTQKLVRQNPQHLTQVIDSVIAFGNAHLLQQTQNKLAVIACHHHATEMLYPAKDVPSDVRQTDGQYELFNCVERTIKQRLSKIIREAPKFSSNCPSLLGGSMTKAMSYINRIKRNAPVGLKFNARILVVTGSSECAAQYLTFMSVFFTAQKMGVCIDVCSLDEMVSPLQQACDLTGGQYLRLNHIDGLLQFLLWVFLPDPHMRQQLVLPPAPSVDYRAACFCHRELIDIGYVCSVCLSIFCKFTPICTTCQAVFKVPTVLPMKGKKKKKV